MDEFASLLANVADDDYDTDYDHDNDDDNYEETKNNEIKIDDIKEEAKPGKSKPKTKSKPTSKAKPKGKTKKTDKKKELKKKKKKIKKEIREYEDQNPETKDIDAVNNDNDITFDMGLLTKRGDIIMDTWDKGYCGNKLCIEGDKLISTNGLRKGNTCLGELIVGDNMYVEWQVNLDHGDEFHLGIVTNDINVNKFFGIQDGGYCYNTKNGRKMTSGAASKYGSKCKRGDKISVILDTKQHCVAFKMNDEDQGIAYKNLPEGQYRLGVALSAKWHQLTLIKCNVYDYL